MITKIDDIIPGDVVQHANTCMLACVVKIGRTCNDGTIEYEVRPAQNRDGDLELRWWNSSRILRVPRKDPYRRYLALVTIEDDQAKQERRQRPSNPERRRWRLLARNYGPWLPKRGLGEVVLAPEQYATSRPERSIRALQPGARAVGASRDGLPDAAGSRGALVDATEGRGRTMIALAMYKHIAYCGQRARVACDGNCSKAWGISRRPCVQLSDNADDYAWLADGELGEAPEDPGTYEGGHAKPRVVRGPEDMNKWCVRECERCVMSEPGCADEPLELRDFSRRFYNIPASDPDHKDS